MYPVTSKFLSAVRNTHNATIRAEVRVFGQTVLELYPTSGNVTIDANSSFRRTMTMTIAEETNDIADTVPVYNNYTAVNSATATYTLLNASKATYSLFLELLSYSVNKSSISKYVPVNAYSPLTPFGNEITVWRGVKYDDGTVEEVPLGVFLITKVDVDANEGGTTIKVDGVDRSLRVSRNKPTEAPYYSSGGTAGVTGTEVINLVTALKNLIQTSWADVKFNFIDVDLNINAFVLGIGEDPWVKAVQIANQCGYDLFFDADGVCTLGSIPDSSSMIPMVTYQEGSEAVLLGVSRSISSDNTYNGVHLTATGTSMPIPFMATAWDEDSSSPTYRYGSFGQVPIFLTSNLLSTKAICEASAVRTLYRYIGASEEISWSSITNPAHDVFDVVQVQNTGTQINVVLIIDSLTIPFGANESMSAKARSIKFLPLS